MQSAAGDPRFPRLPPLSYTGFDPSLTTPAMGVADFGKKIISVAVRFVNHLHNPTARNLKFNNNFQIEFEDGDELEALQVEIGKQLRKKRTKKLFEKKLAGTWDIEFFIMPCRPAPQKLFRFPTLLPGSSRLVTEFVSQSAFNEKQPKLYMEAHIWPK